MLLSRRVTSTAVVTPFLGKVAAVVAPTDKSAVVRFRPATVSAFASAGGAAIVGDGDGDGDGVADGVADALGVGVAVALGEGDAEGFGDAEGDGVLLGATFAGAFFTGAFLTGVFFAGAFFTGFLAAGFLAARARSPIIRLEITPAIIARNFLRLELLGVCVVIRLIPFDCFSPKYENSVSSRQHLHKAGREELVRYMPTRHSYRNLWWGIGIFRTHQ